ncbi:MAG: hypothetical protein A2622_11075 [Bdellovibrionales bacterium RIFCSPHIGHO2_01_FULL_40_29]|nr:MAG: hypothetical protein A2622_11075 [Bdellovibrionales bacterium RIFCSPHIGHO2_01_FULL_40_29]OFZ34495.1 MAG: hypothetical protein A3D17_01340 [Bdellovibrionales bacterium RIFCSPHIGHO2_02_FULL_40_15]
MKKACLVVTAPYDKGEIFNPRSRLNRDNCLQFFYDLKLCLAKNGIDLNTQDIHSPEVCDFIIFNEMPKYSVPESLKNKAVLLLFESELIRPDNWDLKKHNQFKQIFTWNDSFVDNRKYFKFNFTHAGGVDFVSFKKKTGFCTLIAGAKSVKHPLELYSKRIEAIRWFEEHDPANFQFFGMGWSMHTFNVPVLSKILNRLQFLRRAFAKQWPSYHGSVVDKLTTLKKYKFSICYENAYGIPGYITEKIFDSLTAGCIPIYWGAPNVTDFIPQACFIDRTQFSSYEELNTFLHGMTESEYENRLNDINKFLKSDRHKWFEPLFVAQKVTEDMLKINEGR